MLKSDLLHISITIFKGFEMNVGKMLQPLQIEDLKEICTIWVHPRELGIIKAKNKNKK